MWKPHQWYGGKSTLSSLQQVLSGTNKELSSQHANFSRAISFLSDKLSAEESAQPKRRETKEVSYAMAIGLTCD